MISVYAIIKSGGKQLRVEPGQEVNLEKLPAAAGETIELTEVMLIGGDGSLRVGQPTLVGARVTAKVLAQGKKRKVLVFHYKPKKNIRKRQGHRQPFTRVRIETIEG